MYASGFNSIQFHIGGETIKQKDPLVEFSILARSQIFTTVRLTRNRAKKCCDEFLSKKYCFKPAFFMCEFVLGSGQY